MEVTERIENPLLPLHPLKFSLNLSTPVDIHMNWLEDTVIPLDNQNIERAIENKYNALKKFQFSLKKPKIFHRTKKPQSYNQISD